MDDRFDTKRNSFVSRMTARKGISGEKAMRLFDSDNYDSDGDGISNLMERAFGGDSLTNDSKIDHAPGHPQERRLRVHCVLPLLGRLQFR